MSSQLSALEAARPVLERGEPDALASVQGVARAVADTARRAGHSEIVRAAVAASENAARPECLDVLLASLRELANGRDTRSLHLLVIEDDPVTCRFIDAALAAPDRQIHLCRTLAEAEQALATYDVSLVLLDIGLPDGDGRSLLARLRQQRYHAALPIIVVSGSTAMEPREACFQMGADDFIGKPFSPIELWSRVKRFVARP